MAPEKTHLLRCSRFHPSMRRRLTFLGFEFAWMPERQGVPRVKRRTARKKLQAACRRMTAGITQHRHLPGRAFYRQGKSRLRGHDNYDGVPGNSRSLQRFFERTLRCVLTWRNRRGGEATECYLGAVPPGSGPDRGSTAVHDGGQTTEGVRVTTTLCIADARTTEALDTGKLYVRDCTGGAG